MFRFLPNILTVSRIPLAVFFVYFLLQPGLHSKIGATTIFALGMLTDYLDGYLARKYKLMSDFGKLMDPITDKVLTLSAFGVFAWMNLFPWWMFWVVAGREVGITVFRLWAKAYGMVLAAETAGKWKTVLQMTVVVGVLLFLILGDLNAISSTEIGRLWIEGIFVGMLAVVVLTLQSGLSVIANSLAKLKRAKKKSSCPVGLAKFLATAGYMGYMPKLPGTFASFVMCVVIGFWRPSTNMNLGVLAVVILLGWIVCRVVEEDTGRKDPSFVVIDEVAGILISFLFLPVINWPVVAMVFVLFRYFDIKKVLGIRSLEAAGGSAGIMLDDILAGIYTNAIVQLLLLGWRF